MRFASPAGSARDDFLSSRASLGPGNGETWGAGQTRAEKEDGLRQLLTQYRVRCPRCSELMDPDAYDEHDCVPQEKAPTAAQFELELAPPPVPPAGDELLAEHERLLALERARTEVADA